MITNEVAEENYDDASGSGVYPVQEEDGESKSGTTAFQLVTNEVTTDG